jgi:tRNA nucleotidyltransferase (CCA-adding enzyme)
VTARYEHFSHEADVGLRGIGASPAEAFAQVALALTAVVTDLDGVRCEQEVELACEEADLELLLVDFVNALVFEMATRDLLFGRVDVTIDGAQLRATARGEAVDRARHAPAVEPKAATYTALRVARARDGSWVAECVVDV